VPPAPFHHSLHHPLQQLALSEQPRPLGTGTRGESRSGGPQRWTNAAIEWQRWQWRRHQGPIPDAPQSPDNRRSPKLARLEAVLFVADGPLTLRRLIDLATLADAAEARQLINDLNEGYEHDGTAFRVERVASGYQMLTLPEFADWLDRLHQRHAALKLSAPAMETLTIVAYRQPIIRADIEAIRGVQST
jgi:segregation and condensation protein B